MNKIQNLSISILCPLCTRQLTLYFCKWYAFHYGFWILKTVLVRIQHETPGLNFYDSILVGYDISYMSKCLLTFRREVCNQQYPRLHLRENLITPTLEHCHVVKGYLYYFILLISSIYIIYVEFETNMPIIKHVNADQSAESFSNHENIVTICAVTYIIPIH
jgi:hypothetical protein